MYNANNLNKNRKKTIEKQAVVNYKREVKIARDFELWKTGDTDTEERNLPQMSERSRALLEGMSMSKSEEASLWDTMGESFMRNKVRLMNSLWDGKDSAEMKAVKVALDKLSGFYQTGIGTYFKDLTVDPETGLTDRASLEQAKLDAINAYDTLVSDAITSAEHYLNVKNPFTSSGKARYNNVKQLKEQLENEKGGFDGALTFLVTHVAEKKITGEENDLNEIKFADVLRVARAEKHTLTEAGGGVGNTFSFRDAGQKKKYFKANEKIVNDETLPEYFRGILEKEIKGANSGDAALYTKLLNALDKLEVYYREASREFCDVMGVGTAREAIEKEWLERKNKSNVRRTPESQAIIERGKAFYDYRRALVFSLCLKPDDAEDFKKDMGKCQKKLIDSENKELKTLIESINKTVGKIDKKLYGKYHSLAFATYCSGGNGIDNECVVTMRSVATSRMADEISKRIGDDPDYEEAVIGSRIALIKTEKGYKSGIVMDEAKGMNAYDVFERARKRKKPLIFTTKAAKQYNFLMIFDFICGQADRHMDNFKMDYVETRTGLVIKSVQGIDNDFSFGNLKLNNVILKRGHNRMCPILDKNGDFAFKFIDKKLKDAILTMDNSFIELMKHQFADCQITSEQMEAMKKRIEFLQNAIREGINDGKVKTVENEDEWTKLTMENIVPKEDSDAGFAYFGPKNMSDFVYYFGTANKKRFIKNL